MFCDFMLVPDFPGIDKHLIPYTDLKVYSIRAIEGETKLFTSSWHNIDTTCKVTYCAVLL